MTAHSRKQKQKQKKSSRSRKPVRGGANEVSINYGGENINFNMIQAASPIGVKVQHFNRSRTSNVTRKNMRLPPMLRATRAELANQSAHANNLSLAKPSHLTNINSHGNSKARNASRRLYRNYGTRMLINASNQ